MRRPMASLILVALIGGAAYLFLGKGKEVDALFAQAAKTPQEAVERFGDAVKHHNYKRAAHYCTKGYADVLTRHHDAAVKQAEAIDDLRHQLEEHELMAGETQDVLNALDPVPPDLAMLVSNETKVEAQVTFATKIGTLPDWQIGTLPLMALFNGMPASISAVRVTTGGKAEWKLDFPVPPAVQESVANLKVRHVDVSNALNKLTAEVKEQPGTTKENIRNRLQILLEEAAQKKH